MNDLQLYDTWNERTYADDFGKWPKPEKRDLDTAEEIVGWSLFVFYC